MSIPFTQYLMPDGRTQQVSIDRPVEVEILAEKIVRRGYVFEIEVLTTTEISMEVVDPKKEHAIASEICPNGPDVPLAVDRMIENAARYLNLFK